MHELLGDCEQEILITCSSRQRQDRAESVGVAVAVRRGLSGTVRRSGRWHGRWPYRCPRHSCLAGSSAVWKGPVTSPGCTPTPKGSTHRHASSSTPKSAMSPVVASGYRYPPTGRRQSPRPRRRWPASGAWPESLADSAGQRIQLPGSAGRPRCWIAFVAKRAAVYGSYCGPTWRLQGRVPVQPARRHPPASCRCRTGIFGLDLPIGCPPAVRWSAQQPHESLGDARRGTVGGAHRRRRSPRGCTISIRHISSRLISGRSPLGAV